MKFFKFFVESYTTICFVENGENLGIRYLMQKMLYAVIQFLYLPRVKFKIKNVFEKSAEY